MMKKPLPQEIEVSIFGPGFGESILVHIGDNRWIAIDSCIDRRSQKPAPLAYLDSIEVDPQSIELIIASHWHDDHVRGLPMIVDAAPQAKVFCSAALSNREFLAFVAAFNKDPTTKLSGGVREFHTILTSLKRNGRSIITCGIDRRILNIQTGILSHGCACEVLTLSPSDHQSQLFLAQLGNVYALEKQTKFRMQANDPNQISVACQVIIGSLAILLGADLEATNNQRLGWSAVLASAGRSQTKAAVFKIPHHGSLNAHHPGVWSVLLEKDAIAIVTPYERLKNPLPTEADVARIKSMTERGYCTARTSTTSYRHNSAAVNRTLAATGVSLRSITARPGRVTARFQDGNCTGIEMSESAYKL